MQQLFSAVNSYRSILEPFKNAAFSGSFSNSLEARAARERGCEDNKTAVQLSLVAQRRYTAELFSISILAGSILSLAEKFIEIYSKNNKRPANLGFTIKDQKLNFAVGRVIHRVPLGLVIHAARNQHFHFESETYRSPVTEVFATLAERVSVNSGEKYIDPAFELNKFTRPIMAANVLHLIGWSNEIDFTRDLKEILSENES